MKLKSSIERRGRRHMRRQFGTGAVYLSYWNAAYTKMSQGDCRLVVHKARIRLNDYVTPGAQLLAQLALLDVRPCRFAPFIAYHPLLGIGLTKRMIERVRAEIAIGKARRSQPY